MPFKSSPTSDLDQIALKLTHRIKSNPYVPTVIQYTYGLVEVI